MLIQRLTPTQIDAVLALAERSRSFDGVDPLNEEARLSLAKSHAGHLLTTRDGRLLGYLNHLPGLATAQLVVDPAHRRQGIGTSLWLQAPQRSGVWSFGNLPAAQGFAAASALTEVRALMMMTRALNDPVSTQVPEDLMIRSFHSEDAAELLTLNAAAFAHHREQGALDAAGLADRMAQDWFDPEGLILGFDSEGLAGFHWTKAVDNLGEVYVMAVAPRTQGKGYGRALLQAGISHLAAKGLTRVVLYVDTAEEKAVRMYERAGFTEAHRDVFYATNQQEQ